MSDERTSPLPRAARTLTAEHRKALDFLKRKGLAVAKSPPVERLLADLAACGFARKKGNADVYTGDRRKPRLIEKVAWGLGGALCVAVLGALGYLGWSWPSSARSPSPATAQDQRQAVSAPTRPEQRPPLPPGGAWTSTSTGAPAVPAPTGHGGGDDFDTGSPATGRPATGGHGGGDDFDTPDEWSAEDVKNAAHLARAMRASGQAWAICARAGQGDACRP